MTFSLSPLDAVRIFGPLLTPENKGVDQLLKELSTQCSSEEPAQAYILDWLRSVHGYATEGYCYQPCPDIPDAWVAKLREIVELPRPPHAVERIRKGHRVDDLRRKFDYEYSYHEGAYAFGGERAAWKRIEGHYQAFAKGLDGRPLPPPELSDSEKEQAKQEGAIAPGSPRYLLLDRTINDLAAAAHDLYGAITVAHQIGEVPPDPPDAQLSEFLTSAWQVVTGDLSIEEALPGLTGLAGDVQESEALLLARLTEPLFASEAWDNPVLRPIWERRRNMRKDAEELRRQGGGQEEIDDVFGFLAADALDMASEQLEIARQKLMDGARAEQLRGTLERARKLVGRMKQQEPKLVERLRTLEESEPDVKEARKFEVEAAVALRDEQISEAMALVERLEALGTKDVEDLVVLSRAEIEVWKQRNSQVHEREMDSLKSRVREAVEAARRTLADRVEQATRNLGDLRDGATAELMARLDEQLTTVKAELAGGDLKLSRRLVDDLTEELHRLRVIHWVPADGEQALIKHVVAYTCQHASFDEYDVKRLHASLKAKRFAVLAGLTGTGKSTLAREYAAALGARSESGRFRRISVRPNWVDSSEVLGYFNPLDRRYAPGWLATVIRDCQRDPDLPHFVLLDEMNLAPVEHYLSDALTAMEESSAGGDRPTLNLYSSGLSPENAKEWPSELPYPANLFIIGTVNIDESTRPLTDRVLDRTSLIQLRTTVDGRHHDATPSATKHLPVAVRMSHLAEISSREPDGRYHDALVHMGETLSLMKIGLGARNHIEIERLVSNSVGIMSKEAAIDAALLQRILPRIRGYRRDLGDHLGTLLGQVDALGAERTAKVLRHWVEELDDHDYVDGTSAVVGLIAHR